MSVEKLVEWAGDGTLQRIEEAMRHRETVFVRRSSGKEQRAVLASCCGCGGLLCVVAFHVDGPGHARWEMASGADRVHPMGGTMLKRVDTEDLVTMNPWLAGGGS